VVGVGDAENDHDLLDARSGEFSRSTVLRREFSRSTARTISTSSGPAPAGRLAEAIDRLIRGRYETAGDEPPA
jgi:hypothetical protein